MGLQATKSTRRKSLAGAALLGMHIALYGAEEEEIEVVVTADGPPEDSYDFAMTNDPKNSTFKIR